jgi:hypothetical protein
MKKSLYITLIALSFVFTKGIAQQESSVETKRLMTLLNKLEGTYQVQIIDSRELPAIPLTLMDTIIAKRDEKEVKYVWLKNNTRVKILPVREITSSNFKGVERVAHVSSSEIN